MLLQNSFHGRTYGSMAVTTSKTYYRQGFAPLMPQVVVAPYPYCLHCKVMSPLALPSPVGVTVGGPSPVLDAWLLVPPLLLVLCTRAGVLMCSALPCHHHH